jgi:malate/lactate dehydrogenase
MAAEVSINKNEQMMGAITMSREQDRPVAASQSSGVSPVRHQPGGVGVIGAGHVGASVANALALLGMTNRVVLDDRHLARAEGEAWDIADGTPLLRNVEVVATDNWHELSGVRVVVVTVGTQLRPGQSRLEERNGDLIPAVIERLDAVAPAAVVVIVSNPVDVMTRIAQEASSRPWQLILGTGTVLDTRRRFWRSPIATTCSAALTATLGRQRTLSDICMRRA